MTKKVTDLEQFALEQVMRPYQTMLGFEKTLQKLPYPMDEIARHLEADYEWSEFVLNRIYRCGFWFPDYIQHPLVTVIKKYNQKLTDQSKAQEAQDKLLGDRA